MTGREQGSTGSEPILLGQPYLTKLRDLELKLAEINAAIKAIFTEHPDLRKAYAARNSAATKLLFHPNH